MGSLTNPTGPPGAGNPHARWDEGAPVDASNSVDRALLYKPRRVSTAARTFVWPVRHEAAFMPVKGSKSPCEKLRTHEVVSPAQSREAPVEARDCTREWAEHV